MSNCECTASQRPVVSKFITGIPKGSYWVRVMPEYIKEAENPEELLEKYKLETRPQEDDFVLIYGIKENVIAFLEELGEITKQAQAKDFQKEE